MTNDDFDRATAWIIKHASVLLPQFIDDIYKSFDNTSIFYAPDYVEVAKQVCREIPNEFRVTVRQSSFGENDFRKGLYKMSKRVTVSKQEDYLHVYACFEQVSPDYMMMFCKVEFNNSLPSDYFQPLRFVSKRQSVELLINILQSSLSSNTAELLVHLNIINQVSATEVQNLLTAAIDNAQSQQIVDLWDSSIRIDQK
jgi:hypothetical protein